MASLVSALALAPAATAVTVGIDVTPLAPADGGSYTQSDPANGYATVSFSALWSSSRATTLFVEVDNQNVQGQDGTLANDPQYHVGQGSLSRGDADPTRWTGNVSGTFPTTPGTYYFQYYTYGANEECGTPGGTCILASRVFTIRTAGKAVEQPPSWSLANAIANIRPVIRHATSHTPSGLRRACSRQTSQSFSCHVNWYDPRWIWAGVLSLRYDRTDGTVAYHFSGLRASKRCLKNRTMKRCSRIARF